MRAVASGGEHGDGAVGVGGVREAEAERAELALADAQQFGVFEVEAGLGDGARQAVQEARPVVGPDNHVGEGSEEAFAGRRERGPRVASRLEGLG